MILRHLAAGLALALALIGCATTPSANPPPAPLTVFAAASLHAPFTDIAEEFHRRHPEIKVRLSAAGSADLLAQIDAGAPADVVATADEATMHRAMAAGLIIGEPAIFAHNTLSLITPAGNPAGITGLNDSLRGAALVICAPHVPCGAAAQQLAAAHGLALQPVSEEGSVTDVLGKVTTGTADAGIVYASDAQRAGDRIEQIDLPTAQDVITSYAAAVVAGTDHSEAAATWVAALSDDWAQEILEQAGLQLP